MTVTVAGEVGRRWDELREFKGPSIDLMLAVDDDPERVAAAVRDAVRSAVGELMPSEEVDPEWSAGSWQVTSVPGGVSLHVSEYPDAFDEVLSLVAAQLTATGVRGRIELARPAVVELPQRMPLLECRMRPLGIRDGAAWRVKPEDMFALARAAASMLWPASTPGDSSVRYGFGARCPVGEDADGDLLLSEAVATRGAASDVTRSTVNALESVALNPPWGFVTIIMGLVDMEHGWRSVAACLREFLLPHHEQMVYAFVRRGEDLTSARNGSSLFHDWPARPGSDPSATFEGAFEERWAPDAFAVQLLGPGHANRIPADRSWQESKAGGSTLLEHSTPEAWFAKPFVAGGALSKDVRIPDVLAAARSDFQEILIDSDKADAPDEKTEEVRNNPRVGLARRSVLALGGHTDLRQLGGTMPRHPTSCGVTTNVIYGRYHRGRRRAAAVSRAGEHGSMGVPGSVRRAGTRAKRFGSAWGALDRGNSCPERPQITPG